jgi:6-phosphofructokinase 2
MLLIMTKAKIITLTFNPCIDKSTSVQLLMPEKKLYCAIPKLEPGGGGINVARAIKKLGGEATAIFPSGGCTGKVFTALLEKENIDIVAIPTTEETRESISVVEESTNNQYRFGMPSNGLSESEWQQCLKAVEAIKDAEYIVASGSLPLNVPLNIYAQLAKIAKQNKAKLIVDVSGEALKEAVEEGVYLLKPNLGELSALAGKKELQPNEIKDIAWDIIAKGHCEVMVVSMGAAGAMLVTKDMVKTIKPPSVIRKSTVGAGDSMVAGIVLSLSQGKSLIEAAQYGVACGTAATMNTGTELCRKADADKLFKLLIVD